MNVIPDSPWAAAGLDAISGRVLEHLVGVPSAEVTTVAEAAEISPRRAEEALRRLEGALLVIRLEGRPMRWAAGPPRSSLGAVLARRRAQLATAEGILERLQEAYDAASGPRAAHLIEVLEHEEEVSARYTQLLKQSEVEVLHLAKPPYLTGTEASSGEPGVVTGVGLRSVYETDGFTDAVSLETALQGTARGGELRLASRLPVKLVLFDRTAALLPVHSDRPEAGSLVVHSPALVEALAALFESVWAGATPVSLESRDDWPVPGGANVPDGPRGPAGPDVPRVDERTREILRLMATGLKDESIARVLKVSRRTVQKHVTDAGNALGAKTRFQIALRAAGQGWLGPERRTGG
ncbi:LuxR C-terminal-related transcriptional regulator [Streptomyces sp. NBC_01013]|uniref:LuxR C-terminal-related transcriptional regulator n=1 Tax=Streptomyces sp. NBC_01013 TaxID=2903718 RepID=UPI0038679CE8|nr:LuxR C-terminal-related transcriptional regulator [Streptomyces sp. NBC_01013]